MNNRILACYILFNYILILACTTSNQNSNFDSKYAPTKSLKEVYSDSIFNTLVSIISLKPLKICDPCSDRPNERGKSIEMGEYDSIPTITAEGSNRSGNLGGPSLIEIFAKRDDKKIIISSNNTTGSIYTGYEQWEDSYPVDLNDVFTYRDEEKFGIGTAKNTKSSGGTENYLTNIYFKNKDKSIVFMVFDGSEKSTWSQSAIFHFKDTSTARDLVEKLMIYLDKYKTSY
jgi:hypothetical protein